MDEDGKYDEVEENGNDNVDEEDNDDNSGWTEFEKGDEVPRNNAINCGPG